jgi:hypothetical protein
VASCLAVWIAVIEWQGELHSFYHLLYFTLFLSFQ